MARQVEVRERHSNPANPSILGEDVETVLWQAAGLGITAYGNDKVVAPFVQRMVPVNSGAMSKLVDSATTALTAWGLGEGVSTIDKKVGRFMKQGGFVLAGGKLISVLLPSFSISATVPSILPAAPAPKALPSGNGATSTLVRVGRLGI